MSVPAASELDPLLTRQDHRQLSCCCKLSNKPRKFSSKGAALVLMWQFLVIFGVFIIALDIPNQKQSIGAYLEVTAVILLLLVAIISGWLADTKVGRSRVVQTGLFLSWLGTVLVTVGSVLNLTVHTTSNAANGIIIQAVHFVALCTACGGAAIFFTNVVQFGLEQMPDASSDAMTAFISWFVIVTSLGFGSFATVNSLIASNCTNHRTLDTYSLRSITGCVLLSIAMCSKFLFSHWLIDHRQNHNPLKTVYRVLKFAKQHKYPVNRSAFTYCEDEIPSRIDLGKSKYGGPFTTEEVEDVKTFFRILLVLIVIYANAIPIFLGNAVPFPIIKRGCIAELSKSYAGFFMAAIFLICEYIFYPCIKIRYRLSMLKRIGLCMLFVVISNVALFVYAIVTEVGSVDASVTIKAQHWNSIISFWLSTLILGAFLHSILQFIYSQAPEHMKGFFLWTWLAIGTVIALSHQTSLNCSQYTYCRVILTSVAVAISLLVFVVYCCVARWYKRRERDEPCNERAIIEEIYGRHVEHNPYSNEDASD